jgi:hypothetical protein
LTSTVKLVAEYQVAATRAAPGVLLDCRARVSEEEEEAAGTAALSNLGDGVLLVGAGAASNTVGGTAAAVRNVISGNGNNGVEIQGSGATKNVVEGNYIGTNAAGTAALANTYAGVALANGASNNTVGGTAAAARNIISGNAVHGVAIINGPTGNVGEDLGVVGPHAQAVPAAPEGEPGSAAAWRARRAALAQHSPELPGQGAGQLDHGLPPFFLGCGSAGREVTVSSPGRVPLSLSLS